MNYNAVLIAGGAVLTAATAVATAGAAQAAGMSPLFKGARRPLASVGLGLMALTGAVLDRLDDGEDANAQFLELLCDTAIPSMDFRRVT